MFGIKGAQQPANWCRKFREDRLQVNLREIETGYWAVEEEFMARA